MLFKAPEIVREYVADEVDEFQKFLDELLNGSVAINLKQMVSRDFESAVASMFDNLRKTYQEAITNYEHLGRILHSLAQNDELLARMESQYSPIFESNFRFALASLATIMQTFYMSIKGQEVPEFTPPEDLIERLIESFSKLSILSNSEMPDAVSIFEPEDEFQGLFAMILLAYNFGLFAALVIVTAMIAASEASPSAVQIEEIETLLRDWPQEFVAQTALIQKKSRNKTGLFSLSGIIMDDTTTE